MTDKQKRELEDLLFELEDEVQRPSATIGSVNEARKEIFDYINKLLKGE